MSNKMFLRDFGVDCEDNEESPRGEGEGQFTAADYHLRIVPYI